MCETGTEIGTITRISIGTGIITRTGPEAETGTITRMETGIGIETGTKKVHRDLSLFEDSGIFVEFRTSRLSYPSFSSANRTANSVLI